MNTGTGVTSTRTTPAPVPLQLSVEVMPMAAQDVRLVWTQGYRPPCPVCTQETTGLLDRGRYTDGRLGVRTLAEPCGCDVSAHVPALQLAAAHAGAIA